MGMPSFEIVLALISCLVIINVIMEMYILTQCGQRSVTRAIDRIHTVAAPDPALQIEVMTLCLTSSSIPPSLPRQ